jgi:hypothetical protein
MESKGRRAPRSTGPIPAPAASLKPDELPAAAVEPTNLTQPAGTPVAGATVEALAAATRITTPGDRAYLGRDVVTAFAQSQAALARGLEALSAEMAGLALSGIETAARTATKMLAVKTLSDAIEVNTGFTCSHLNAVVGGSATLSQLGAKLAAETSQPLLNQFGKGWNTMGRYGS